MDSAVNRVGPGGNTLDAVSNDIFWGAGEGVSYGSTKILERLLLLTIEAVIF